MHIFLVVLRNYRIYSYKKKISKKNLWRRRNQNYKKNFVKKKGQIKTFYERKKNMIKTNIVQEKQFMAIKYALETIGSKNVPNI